MGFEDGGGKVRAGRRGGMRDGREECVEQSHAVRFVVGFAEKHLIDEGPTTETNVDTRVEHLDLVDLGVDRFDPRQDTRALLLEVWLAGRAVGFDSQTTQGTRYLLAPAGVQITQVVKSRQGLGELDFMQIGGEAATQEASDKARGQSSGLGGVTSDKIRQLRSQLAGGIDGLVRIRGRLGRASAADGVHVEAVHGTQRDFIGAGVA